MHYIFTIAVIIHPLERATGSSDVYIFFCPTPGHHIIKTSFLEIMVAFRSSLKIVGLYGENEIYPVRFQLIIVTSRTSTTLQTVA